VQVEVHAAEADHLVDDIDAAEGLLAELALASAVLRLVFHVVVSGEQETARAAGWIVDGLAAITSTMELISGRGVKYWPAPDFTSPAFFSSRPS
jgi:hypothetical protein